MAIAALINEVIEREGDYSDHPADRGGPTRWGVTEQVARAYAYAGSMKVFPRETAVAIYTKRYWTLPGFDKVAAVYQKVGEELFDTGINMGPVIAGKFLQRALNLFNNGVSLYPNLTVDGVVGPMSILNLKSYQQRRGEEGGLVLDWMISAFRSCRYAEIAESNPSQEVFEYGWIARQVRAA